MLEKFVTDYNTNFRLSPELATDLNNFWDSGGSSIEFIRSEFYRRKQKEFADFQIAFNNGTLNENQVVQLLPIIISLLQDWSIAKYLGSPITREQMSAYSSTGSWHCYNDESVDADLSLENSGPDSENGDVGSENDSSSIVLGSR